MAALLTRTQIPEGVRDRLPGEAARIRTLFGRLEHLFGAWGYHEVVTPGFEYLETVVAGPGSLSKREDLYQFFDRRGRTLALRADMTTPIARLAATKMAGEPLPLRLSYFAPVYRRRDRRAGVASEILQAGIELVGAAGPAADAEVIAMACEAIASTGVEGFQIGLGHVDFVEGIFSAASLSPEQDAELKEALVSRDLVSFEKGVMEAGLAPEQTELLLSLATFQGTYAQALERYRGVGNGRVARALEQLGLTLALLEELGVADQVSLDLGLVRSLRYYTGILFEGYAPGVGSSILGGGRYDQLLSDFGSELDATGFALEIDRLLMALERQDRLPTVASLEVIVECPAGMEAQAMAKARQLRSQGLTVEVDLLGRTGAELQAYASARGARRVLSPSGNTTGRFPHPRTSSGSVPPIH